MAFGRTTEMVPGAVISVSAKERVDFIRRTYLHLFAAIAAFVGLEVVLLNLSFTRALVFRMVASPWSWVAVLVLFMVVGWIADKWAHSAESRAMQYLGLGLYVVAEAIIFLPLLFIGAYYSDPSVIPTAGLLTGIVFSGLTATVFITGKDFSYLRGALMVGFFAALGIILCGAIFGFKLGLLFSGILVVLAGAYVLYVTSNVLYHYRTDQHVAASLSLFAAIALLFWYILRIVIALAGRD